MKDNWNSHYLRKSRHHTASGIPNKLYFLLETVGSHDYVHAWELADMDEVERELNAAGDAVDDADPGDNHDEHEYQDYFSYVVQMLDINYPNTWQEALSLYTRILALAE